MTDTMTPSLPASAGTASKPAAGSHSVAVDKARAIGRKLETAFLAEMLRHTTLGRPPQSWGGGPGEDAFRSFFLDAVAEKLGTRVDLGLARQLAARAWQPSPPPEGA